MTVEPWRIITPKQLKEGWIEMRGVTPIHHAFIVIAEREDGNFTVRNPDLQILEMEERGEAAKKKSVLR